MTLWLLRFVPYAGGAQIDGYYRSETRAHEQYTALTGYAGRCEFKDDYGVAFAYNPAQGALVLINTETSARMGKDLNDANHDAARRQGIVPKIATGSTVQ